MEKKEIAKVWDSGTIRECTQNEIEEFAKENEVSIPYVESFTYDELVNIKIRERYSESQEFAILRQRDEKPDEYAEYYRYCEQCKNYVKEMTGEE